MSDRVYSHHMLRRRARATAARWNAGHTGTHRAVVRKAQRGPWRYRVVVVPRPVD